MRTTTLFILCITAFLCALSWGTQSGLVENGPPTPEKSDQDQVSIARLQFQQIASDITNKGREWAKAQLEVAKTKYSDVSEQLDEFVAELQVVQEMATQAVRDLDGKVDWEKFVDALFEKSKIVVRSIEMEFELPLPDDTDKRNPLHEEEKRTKKVLNQAEESFFEVLEEQGIGDVPEKTRSIIEAIKRTILRAAMIASASLASFTDHLHANPAFSADQTWSSHTSVVAASDCIIFYSQTARPSPSLAGIWRTRPPSWYVEEQHE